MWVRVVPSRNRNNHVYEDKKTSFKIVGLAIAQEITHDNNRKHEQHNHEDFEIEPPANYNNKGSIEEGGLNGRSEAVVQRKIDLVVPFVTKNQP
ncbi:hypothetical protein PRK78_003405 [Emydomyces testavorans]|uniref:Uncharacterized protein n=1 Tax=Emydomyces testavorans TaxID=2070801 RepID=A0AAF0DGS0_9EURO|nr:hypothetical protein PRK78_003405 [Emydomyces testavorans]